MRNTVLFVHKRQPGTNLVQVQPRLSYEHGVNDLQLPALLLGNGGPSVSRFLDPAGFFVPDSSKLLTMVSGAK